MNKNCWLIIALSVAVLFAVHVTSSKTKGRKYLPMGCLLDAVDNRTMNNAERWALAEIEYRRMQRAAFDVSVPTCDFSNWTTPSCEIAITLFSKKFEIKAAVQLNLKRLSIYAALSLDDEVIIDASFYLSKICVRFYPYFPKLGICGHVYYFDVNFGSPLFVEACLTVTIADMLELRFYCIQLEHGELTRQFDVEPEEKAPFAVVFKSDRVIFEFNSAIPELLLALLGEAIEMITDAIMMLYNAVTSVVNSVINIITDFFNPPPRIA